MVETNLDNLALLLVGIAVLLSLLTCWPCDP